MTMDTIKGEYFDLVRDYFNKELANEEVELNFVDLVSQTIYRCVSCDICPSPRHLQKNKSKKNPYNCIVQVKMDSMKEIQRKIVDSDAVVLAGVNSQSDLIYRYQAFMERTRYIRRGDFELTNKVVLSLVINNIGSSNNSIHALKVLTSFIRHNMFVTKPIEITKNKGEVIHQDSICEQMEAIRAITLGRQLMVSDVVCYKATGYSNCELDHTSKSRK